MIVFECTPNSIADIAKDYETLKVAYEGNEFVVKYRMAKSETKKATKECLSAGIGIREIVGSIEGCESFDNLSKKCARHFADVCAQILTSEGFTFKKKDKQPQSPQVAKTWENKVVKYEALCNGASPEIQAKFREAFTPPSVEKKAELLQKMRDSAHLFDQNFAALKAQKEIDRPLKDLGKAFKQARKGEDGVMTRVQANRTQIQRDWQDYQRAFREHGVSEKLIEQIGEKAGV